MQRFSTKEKNPIRLKTTRGPMSLLPTEIRGGGLAGEGRRSIQSRNAHKMDQRYGKEKIGDKDFKIRKPRRVWVFQDSLPQKPPTFSY